MTYSCSDLAEDVERGLNELGHFVSQDDNPGPIHIFNAFARLCERHEQILKENEILAARVMDLENRIALKTKV